MPFHDDIADRFPELERATEQPVEVRLATEDVQLARRLAIRLGTTPERTVTLALALLARGGGARR